MPAYKPKLLAANWGRTEKGKTVLAGIMDGMLLASAIGRMSACQLFWELEIRQSEAGTKKPRSDTCVGVPLAPVQSNRDCAFVYFRLC